MLRHGCVCLLYLFVYVLFADPFSLSPFKLFPPTPSCSNNKFSGAFPSMKNCTELDAFCCWGNNFTNIPNDNWNNDKEAIRRECASIFKSEVAEVGKGGQSGAALRLWTGLGGKEEDLTGGKGHDELSQWAGIETNADGEITKVDWYEKGLSGTISEEPLGKLTALTYLGLDDNNLTGEIPSSIGNLTNLTRLYLK